MPSEKRLWLEDGKREYKRKNYNEAINYFNHQIRENVRDTEAWYYKGKAWQRLEKLSEAQSCFQKVCDFDPGRDKGWARLGETQMEMERVEEALDTYTKGIEGAGRSAILWLGKSRVFIAIGANQKANEALDTALDIDPNLGEAWLEKGRLLDESGIFEGAIECYTKATRYNKQLSEAWFMKGRALEQLGRYKEAIRCFDWTTKIEDDNLDAWYRKGNSLYVLGRTKRALEAFEMVLKIDAEHRDSIFKVGQIHEEMGNVKLALQYYSLADKEEGWEETLTTKGDAFFRMDRLDEALKAYDSAIESNPNNFKAWAGKGKIKIINEEYKEAVDCFNQSIRFEPRNDETWQLKANALFYLHKYGESFSCFDNAIELSADSIPIHLDKAMSLIALSRTVDASGIVAEVLRKEPDNVKGNEIFEMLKDSGSRANSPEIRQQRELYHNSKQSLDTLRSNIMVAESILVDVTPFRSSLSHAVNEMKSMNFLAVMGIVKTNIKKLNETSYEKMSLYLDETWNLLKGLDMSVDSTPVEEILRKAEGALNDRKFTVAFSHIESTLDEIESLREMSERLSSLRRQDPRYLDEARATLKEIREMLEEAERNNLDASHIERLVEKASIAELRKDYMESATILNDAKKYARNLLVTLSLESSVSELEKDAKKAIDRVEVTLKKLRTFDFLYPESDELLKEAKEKLSRKSFPEAYILAKRSLSNIRRVEKLERIVELYEEGQNLVAMTKKFKNFPTDKLEKAVNESRTLLGKKKINDALNILEGSVPEFSERLKNKALVVKLKVTQQKMLKLKKLGKDISKVQALVVKSRPAMETKDYDTAIRYVEGALRLANKILAA